MPTVTISGAANIQDTFLVYASANPSFADWCEGGNAQIAMQNGSQSRVILVRFTNALLPAGSVTGFRLKFYAQAGWDGVSNMAAWRILAANAWVGGTVQHTPEVGSACWNWRSYNTTPWAGSAGLGVSGVDYEANASPPTTVPPGFSQWATLVLPPSWASDWKSGAMVNNGLLLKTNNAGSTMAIRSVNDGQYPLYFEIDYTLGGGEYIPSLLTRRI